MHVGGISLDLNWFLQFIFTIFLIALGLLYLVKNTASKYFEVDANFEGGRAGAGDRDNPVSPVAVTSMEAEESLTCANCGSPGSKKCSRCKSVRYCSSACQEAHWKSGHNSKCKPFSKLNPTQSARTNFGFKASDVSGRTNSSIALVPGCGTSKLIKKPRKVLFPYDEFIELYNWNKSGFPPCGLLNCGNSCFANVVLQCLTYTRPLVAYLLEKGHQRECRRNDWCFLCEFERHVVRSSQSLHPFSPINVLSRLPNIGGNLGYGRQEDAHEFMRFAIDTMQSVCFDEFGGEKAVEPSSQETTLIQHIFGGHLQSQVICTNCNKISNQLENMMDLTVEIHGDAASLEECLDQFTQKEWLHGENMYKCDGCNDYVKAWKRLTIRRAPNILTIALKRFQSGRFGKLNKRVTFPEILNLSPYMSEGGDGADVYKLYAVVVHVDMLNASFFGHYICYTKDFCGNWYRIDDCKVASVELEEVLSQGAYMLLYSRVSARPTCLRTVEPSKEEQKPMGIDSCPKEKVALDLLNGTSNVGSFPSNGDSGSVSKASEDVGAENFDSRTTVSNDVDPGLVTKPFPGVDPALVRVDNSRGTLNSGSHPICFRTVELSMEEQQPIVKMGIDAFPKENAAPKLLNGTSDVESFASDSDSKAVSIPSEDGGVENFDPRTGVSNDVDPELVTKSAPGADPALIRVDDSRNTLNLGSTIKEVSGSDEDASIVSGSGSIGEEPEDMDVDDPELTLPISMEGYSGKKDPSTTFDPRAVVNNPDSSSTIVKNIEVNGHIY